jgi:addiction module HigA family antidote
MSKRDIPPIHPGEILLEEFLKPLGLSQARLARDLRVPLSRVRGIIQGRQPITGDTALRLARYFRVDARTWMNLQTHYDLEVAEEALEGTLKRIKPREAA